MDNYQSAYLVAYFSPQGRTAGIAKYLAQAVFADLQEIEPKEPYTEDDLNWKRFFSRCNKEHRKKTLPDIEAPMFELDKFSVVFLGFPIWYGKAPNIIKSFLRLNNWNGQKIVLFATSGGGGIEKAEEDLKKYVGPKKIVASHLFESDADMDEITKWGNGIKKQLCGDLENAAADYVAQHYVEPPKPVHITPEKPVVKEEADSYKTKYSRPISGHFSMDLNNEEREKQREEQRQKNQEILESQKGRVSRDRYNRNGILAAMRDVQIAPGRSNSSAILRSLDNYTDQSFVSKLTQLIRERGMVEPAVYKAAQIDRKLFSKIVSDKDYKPSKDTCIALAYALHLDLTEANDLLSRAGYTFSHSSKRDVILEYFFVAGKYNIYDINEVLFQLAQKPLGRMA